MTPRPPHQGMCRLPRSQALNRHQSTEIDSAHTHNSRTPPCETDPSQQKKRGPPEVRIPGRQAPDMNRLTRKQLVELVAITLHVAAIATQNAGHEAIAHTLDTIALTLRDPAARHRRRTRHRRTREAGRALPTRRRYGVSPGQSARGAPSSRPAIGTPYGV